MADSSAGVKRSSGFVLGKCVNRAPPKKIPKAAELIMNDGLLPPPPPGTMAFFEAPCDLWIALDIETHELIPNTDDILGWPRGQFGHKCRITDTSIADLRAVQFGTCTGRFSSNDPPHTKSIIIQPNGFAISEAATGKHKITNEHAASNGVPLDVALADLLADIFEVDRRGGRLCAHQLEFDAGVVKLEMQRAGLGHMVDAFVRIATAGFCTMSPCVTRWACDDLVEQTRHHDWLGASRAIGLKDMVRALLPDSRALLEQHHNAAADARMDWMVLRELYNQALSARSRTNTD